jgi:glycosyltransferase involved in cell wall biosynthesis
MPDDPLNVLLVAGRFEVRGATSYTLRLAEHLEKYGVRPTIVCSNAEGIESTRRARLQIREYPHVELPVVGRLLREWILPPLHESPPDLIHIQARPLLGLGSWLARRRQRPFVITVHDFPPAGRRPRFDRQLGPKVIAVSDSVRDAVLEAWRLPPGDVTVIHSGVETEPAGRSLPVLEPGHVPVVGTAGPLEAVKGLPYFLSAAQKVNKVRDDVQFLIAGAGPEEANLRRLARRLKIDRQVTFAPNLRDFGPSVAAVDVFCLPSLQQGLGSIMLEAMAMGKPVIASAVGGIHSVIRDGETGLLVPPSQSAPIAEGILDLLRDPVRARAIGEAGRAFVKHEFRAETMVERTVEVYHQVLEAWRPVPQEATSK